MNLEAEKHSLVFQTLITSRLEDCRVQGKRHPAPPSSRHQHQPLAEWGFVDSGKVAGFTLPCKKPRTFAVPAKLDRIK